MKLNNVICVRGGAKNKVVDVKFVYGRFHDDSTWKGLMLHKSWEKFDLGLMIMKDAKEMQFSDNASLTLSYNL